MGYCPRQANVALFDASRRLFRDAHTRAAYRQRVSAGFDVIIEPSIDAFEFSLPSQSATNKYSVWIRYTVSVFRPDGELLTAWNVSAYGEAAETTPQPARSMEQATILALRDAATTITLGFAASRDRVLQEKSDAGTQQTTCEHHWLVPVPLLLSTCTGCVTSRVEESKNSPPASPTMSQSSSLPPAITAATRPSPAS